MVDLNRFVIQKYAQKWKNICIELGLEFDALDKIDDSNVQSTHRFQRALNMWLKTERPTWSVLEVAITNVNRTEASLDPVVCVYGKDFVSTYCSVQNTCVLNI